MGHEARDADVHNHYRHYYHLSSSLPGVHVAGQLELLAVGEDVGWDTGKTPEKDEL